MGQLNISGGSTGESLESAAEMALGTVGLVGKQEQKIFPIMLQCGLDIRTENKTGEINLSNFQLYFIPFFFFFLSLCIIAFQK